MTATANRLRKLEKQMNGGTGRPIETLTEDELEHAIAILTACIEAESGMLADEAMKLARQCGELDLPPMTFEEEARVVRAIKEKTGRYAA